MSGSAPDIEAILVVLLGRCGWDITATARALAMAPEEVDAVESDEPALVSRIQRVLRGARRGRAFARLRSFESAFAEYVAAGRLAERDVVNLYVAEYRFLDDRKRRLRRAGPEGVPQRGALAVVEAWAEAAGDL